MSNKPNNELPVTVMQMMKVAKTNRRKGFVTGVMCTLILRSMIDRRIVSQIKAHAVDLSDKLTTK